jgi:hypothetical protein
MNLKSRIPLIVVTMFVTVGLVGPTPSFAAVSRVVSITTLPDGSFNVLRGLDAAQSAGRIDVIGGATSVVFTIQTSGVTFATPSVAENNVVLLAPGFPTTSIATQINSSRTAITASYPGFGTVRLQNVKYFVPSTVPLGPITVRVSGPGITTQDVSNATVVDAGTTITVSTSPIPVVTIDRLDQSAGTVRIRELASGSIVPNPDVSGAGATGADLTMTLPPGVTVASSVATTAGTAPTAFVQVVNRTTGTSPRLTRSPSSRAGP